MMKATQGVESNAGHYGLIRHVSMSFAEASQKVRERLKEQGFGVITEIDVRKTMKEKLDRDFTPYLILGACNPSLAHRALTADADVGLLLPCNVTVYEDPATGGTVVGALDPQTMVALTGRPDLQPLADEVRTRLIAALVAL